MDPSFMANGLRFWGYPSTTTIPDPQRFISDFESLCHDYNIPEDEYVTTVQKFFLRDSSASDWYDREIKDKVTVWQEFVGKFKKTFPPTIMLLYQQLRELAWEKQDRSAHFEDVADAEPGQKYESLKVIFPYTAGTLKSILVTSEYKSALSDAKRWFAGQEPPKKSLHRRTFIGGGRFH
ncbi:hypothetical protein E1B28_012570 [Marasmius oreades]|uniref:Uncharacterized protein n=1 Tax=Marasmius oreades TaxID=181124 RepID=A0A9P7UP41_9AGAR|nr:uncharacterized protein E1B28_012570 [Marasmius oreades]KAG7088595.1 hypothetical protein E1B28_012570 [Marasmius oreades]